MTNTKIEIVVWNDKLEKQAYALLNKYRETSMFLLSNIKAYGTKLTKDTYSGDFKLLVKAGEVVGVFVLTKIGNLLIQTDRARDHSSIIIDECLKGALSLKGVVGELELAKPLWDCAKKHLPNLHEKFNKKEILFQIDLNNLSDRRSQHEVRYLQSSDYQVWSLLNKGYLQEGNLDQREDEVARYNRFLKDVENSYWYGLFIDGQLISIACCVSNIDDIGWIGGVYTNPKMRNQGLAKELIYNLLLDGRVNKNLSKDILFTGENNYVAIRIYEGLGFKRIGYFGLFFGDY